MLLRIFIVHSDNLVLNTDEINKIKKNDNNERFLYSAM